MWDNRNYPSGTTVRCAPDARTAARSEVSVPSEPHSSTVPRMYQKKLKDWQPYSARSSSLGGQFSCRSRRSRHGSPGTTEKFGMRKDSLLGRSLGLFPA